MMMKFGGGVFGGLLLILYFGGTTVKGLRDPNDIGIIPEDNPTPFKRYESGPKAEENLLSKLAQIDPKFDKGFFANMAVCWVDVLDRSGDVIVGLTLSNNWQPRYFCANVPNGWWDAAIKETDPDERKKIAWEGYDFFTPGAKFWIEEPTFDHWLARPMDPNMMQSKKGDAKTEAYLNKHKVVEDLNLQSILGSRDLPAIANQFRMEMMGKNKQRREIVEAKGLFWKVAVTGIGIKHQDNGNKKEEVATILKGWYHLHVTLAQHVNEGSDPLKPEKIKLATGQSKDYIIDRLMISARGVRLIQRHRLPRGQRGSGSPYLIKGVTGGVGRFVTDFPACVFKDEEHPGAGETILFNKFVPEQELPCGTGNAFTHEVGNNFIYVRTDQPTKYGGNGKDKTDLHVNFRIGHPPCGHVYELDFVVVGVVVKKDIALKGSYFHESLESDPNVMYIQRSMSTRFHFIKSHTTPKFFGAPDPLPITINPDDLSCSIQLQEEPLDPKEAANAGPESFFGAIKKIQKLNFKEGEDPFAELNDPTNEVFNPITVMYPDLYSKNDKLIGDLREKNKGVTFPEMDALYLRYFKPMTYSTLKEISSKEKEGLKMVKGYCTTLIDRTDWALNGKENDWSKYPEYPIHPGTGSTPPDKLHVSPFRQLLDPLTRYPLWDFTCVGGGGIVGKSGTDYDKKLGQFVGLCPPVTEHSVSGFYDMAHASCDFGLLGKELAPWNETTKETLDGVGNDVDIRIMATVHSSYYNYIERYDATSTVREYMEKSADWEEYNLGGSAHNNLEQQKAFPGHRKLNLEFCEAVDEAKKRGEAYPKCLVLPPRPFTETPPPPTTRPPGRTIDTNLADLLGLKAGDPLPDVPPDNEGSDGEETRGKRRNKRSKKKPKGSLIPGAKKGKAIDDDLSKFEWDTRIFHGVAFTLLTTFVIPVNAILTRYFKETFMHKRIYNLRVWYFFHLTASVSIPAIFIVGLARGLMTSGFLGHSYSAVAVWHRALGWLSISLSLAMVFFGWLRHMNLQINWIIVALHWVVGYLIYFLMLTCTLLAIWIPGSPAALYDVTYSEFSLANLPTEAVFMSIMLFLAFDITMHILLSVLQCRNDRLMLLNGPRLYLPAPIPVLAENSTFDAPGYIWRKLIFIIYVFVAAVATATIITFMCLYSPKGRGFGAMTCTHADKNVSKPRSVYPDSC